jgi:hypothetical protein
MATGAGFSGRPGRDRGSLAWYNGDAYRPARERSGMATHNKTVLPYVELLNHIASGERVVSLDSVYKRTTK